MYGIRWVETNKKDQMVMKQKFFATEKARDKFADRVEQKDNFIRFESRCNNA